MYVFMIRGHDDRMPPPAIGLVRGFGNGLPSYRALTDVSRFKLGGSSVSYVQ